MSQTSNQTAFARFKNVAIAEGISYILLLGVAMPMKYYMDMPLAVRITGSIHGLLFIFYIFTLLQVTTSLKWPISKAALAFLASLVPFAPFFLDRLLLKKE